MSGVMESTYASVYHRSNMTRILFYGIALFILLLIFCQIDSVYATEKVIFDTDIGPDWDDVGATAVLHALANSSEAEILAMMVSSGGHSATWGPPCLDAFNTYYGRPDIPIGVATGGPSFGSSYNQQIAEEFEQDLGTGNAWNSVELYRKVLSEQADSSVVIITTGFMTNLATLLHSEPDDYSTLNGLDLVNRKVRRWVCMGGGFPGSGGEFNFNRDATATKYAVENWAKPILFSGFEIGSPIHTGAKLALTSESNPIRRAYELAGGYVGSTRSSWDQTAILAAIRDPLLYWDLVTTGYCEVADNGSNAWHDSPDKDHSYLVKKLTNAEMVEIIDDLMANLQGLPEVSIISPDFGSSFEEGTDIAIETAVQDTNGQIVKVEFFARSTKIGEDTTPPFGMIWTDVARGGYYLSARVTDDDNQQILSDPVKIFVGNVDQTLVGHWLFENSAADSSDHGNDGAISGQPQFIAGRRAGKAIRFDSDGEFITVATSPDFSITGFTLAAWVKIPSPISTGWRTIIEHNRWGKNWFGLWKSANGNKFHFRWTNTGTATSDFNAEISPDSWYHVAATYDADEQTARLYLNGGLDKTIDNADSPAAELAELSIGINGDRGEDFQGIIDDLRIYNCVLNETEINAMLWATAIGHDGQRGAGANPDEFQLSNFPNPFNCSTTIQYRVPVESYVTIALYDIGGIKLKTLVQEKQAAGSYFRRFYGNDLSSGVYVCRIMTEQTEINRKMLLLK